MKCGKVIAQRKFAQGVCVPHPPVQVDKKQVPHEKLENIHHVKTSASNLLDLITYNGIHHHLLHPVVCLEKMQDAAIHTNGNGINTIETIKTENNITIKSPTALSDDDVPLMFLASEKKTVIEEASVKLQLPENSKQKNEKKPQIKRSRSCEDQTRNQTIGTKRTSRSSGLNNQQLATSPPKKRKSAIDHKTTITIKKKGPGGPRRSGRKRQPPEVFISNSARNKNNAREKIVTKMNMKEPLKKKVNEKEIKDKIEPINAKKCINVKSTLREISSRVSTEPELYSPNEIERWIEDGLTSQRSPSVDHEFKTPVVPDRPPAGNTRLHASKSHQELSVCTPERSCTIKETIQKEVDKSCSSPKPQNGKSVNSPEPSSPVVATKKPEKICNRHLNYSKTHPDLSNEKEQPNTLNEAVQQEPEKANKNRQLNKKRETDKSPANIKENDVYIFSDDSEQSVENHGLSDFRRRQSDSASTQNEETEDALINILGPDNSKIVLATFAKASKMKKLLRAKLVDKADSRYKDLPIIERNFLENLVNIIKLPNGNNSSQSPDLLQVADSSICSSSQNKLSTGHVVPPTTTTREAKPVLIDAPIFKPTIKEFSDPIAYIEKIAPEAAKYGLCKVVPPEDFAPPCLLDEEISFNVSNQNIARMYSRWGRGMREMSAFKVCAAKQGVQFTRPPLIEGVEVNLPKLFHLVQDYGGLNGVLEKKRWGRIAEQMRLSKAEKKLDLIYVKYLLPFETMSQSERHKILSQIDKRWDTKSKAMMDRANNPFHRQKRLQGESDSSDDETDDGISFALKEAEDCVTLGRRMNVATYQKVATHVKEHLTPDQEPSEVEKQYWKYVLLGNDHICVHSASIDTGEQGYGFPKNQKSLYGKHTWNMKMISSNNRNMLRFLGPVIGVTVPTLHLGMTFSTSCWHRDPHGLPWIEYMHSGPTKIWYGIPEQQSEKFRKAVETLCPAFCQNKPIWLPSDIAMIPPKILQEHNICLSRLEQNPGEFVIVFPKAYSCSICTGYTISESVYFATNLWLSTIHQVFQEVQNSCEPTMFSLEQLLLGAVRDTRTPIAVIQQVTKLLSDIIGTELENRKELARKGVTIRAAPLTKKRPLWADINSENSNECEYCRSTLYLSKVTGLTNNRSALCLHHAITLLETEKYKTENLRLQLEELYSETSLKELLKSANSRLAV